MAERSSGLKTRHTNLKNSGNQQCEKDELLTLQRITMIKQQQKSLNEVV